MDIYAQLARGTIEQYITREEIPAMEGIAIEIKTRRVGCFVSIHKKDGELRGCIGTIRPYYKNLAGEIMANAVAAATQDPRFGPIRKDELDDLEVSVDILGITEPIESEKELDAKKYGVIVRSLDGREGLLLPDIDNVKTVTEQTTIAREKAGIAKDEEVSLFRFEVERHK